MTRYVIGVDLGTGGPKVLLATTDGRVLGHEAEKVALYLLPGGGAEQDPHDWWRAIVSATRRLLADAAIDVEAVTAICVSSQWGGLVPVDDVGEPVHRAVIWMDARGAERVRALIGAPAPRVPGTPYSAASLRLWLSRTGGAPSPSGKDPVGQAQWLRHERREAWAATRWLLDVPEYLTMRMTGRAVAGWDTAVLRWCTDNRDPSSVRWDDDLLRRNGFDRAMLPELVPPGSIVGTLTARAATELGLPTSVRVVTGTGDTTAAAVGAGAVEEYSGHLYIGTSAWLSCHVPFKRTDVRRNIASLPAVVPGQYWVATVQDVAGKAIDWVLDHIVYSDDALFGGQASGIRPNDALDRLNALAASSPPGSNGVIFTPWLNGERTPVDDPYVRGGWANVSLSTDRADLARAVFEGIALNARWMKEAVERFVRGPGGAMRRSPRGGFESLTFVGGGARSELWCQTLADVLNCRILQVDQPVLANARGAALIAAVAVGAMTWQDVPQRVRIAETYEPQRSARAVYDERYAMFTELYRRNQSLYSRFNRR